MSQFTLHDAVSSRAFLVFGNLLMTDDRSLHFMERWFRDTECTLNIVPSRLALRVFSEPGKGPRGWSAWRNDELCGGCRFTAEIGVAA
jgi:hypothetical protein